MLGRWGGALVSVVVATPVNKNNLLLRTRVHTILLHYNYFALVTTSLSRFLFKSKPGGRSWQQPEEEGEEEQSPE